MGPKFLGGNPNLYVPSLPGDRAGQEDQVLAPKERRTNKQHIYSVLLRPAFLLKGTTSLTHR